MKQRLQELLLEYVAASDYPSSAHIGLLTTDQIEVFIEFFGQKVFDFFKGRVYYVGEDEGQHYFTNQESWYKFRQQK